MQGTQIIIIQGIEEGVKHNLPSPKIVWFMISSLKRQALDHQLTSQTKA